MTSLGSALCAGDESTWLCSCTYYSGGGRTTELRNAATMDGLNSFSSIPKERFWGWWRKGRQGATILRVVRRRHLVALAGIVVFVKKVSDRPSDRRPEIVINRQSSSQSLLLPNRLNSASVHRSSAHSRIHLSIEQNKSPPSPLPFSLSLSSPSTADKKSCPSRRLL